MRVRGLFLGLVSVLLLNPSSVDAQIAASTFIAGGLAQPVAFVQDPTDPAVQFVVEQGGRIRVIESGVLQAGSFLDVSGSISSGGERGLLGLAFPPDAAASRRFYVNFTDAAGNTVIARFMRSAANPLVADPSSRFDLRWGGPSGLPYIEQPFANHNGGTLVFGPDGCLYIGMGDGGSGFDPLRRAQDPAFLLGKMLRIDVNVPASDPQGYRVPIDNPFVGPQAVATLPEIWDFGVRNPWKFTFDDGPGGTGALVIGDVGQNAWEEVDYEPANRGGRNYGWVVREGRHATNVAVPPPGAPMTLTDPIFEYDHPTGFSITGGYVYRGTDLAPSFNGRYFFADFIVGRLWSIALLVDPVTGEASASDLVEHTAQLGGGAMVGNISSFGRDSLGELYLVQYSGSILKIRSIVRSVSLTPDRAAPQLPGVTVRLTAAPTGGTAPYQYKWWVFDGATWTAVTGWTSSATFDWTPMAASPNYYVGVWVKSAGNAADAPEVPISVPYRIVAPERVTSVALAPDRMAPQAPGTTVTWTAMPSGGTAPYQYKWWVYDGVAWTPVTNWTMASTFDWTPMAAGNYYVGVWVKSAGNLADVAEVAQSMPFTIAGAAASTRVSSVSLTSDRMSPQSPGTTIRWTATPSGGTAPYQYKWWVYDGVAWTPVTDWTMASTFDWTPMAAGSYYVGVWVKSAGNAADAPEAPSSAVYSIAGPVVSARVTSVALTPDRAAPQLPGVTVRFSATPSGGTGPYQYKWWVWDGMVWTAVSGWTTASAFDWMPAAAYGGYYVGVWVKSAGNMDDGPEVAASVAFPIVR